MAVELTCDRCGKAIFSSKTNIPTKAAEAVRAKISEGGYTRHTIDLCEDCGKELDAWLAEGKQ